MNNLNKADVLKALESDKVQPIDIFRSTIERMDPDDLLNLLEESGQLDGVVESMIESLFDYTVVEVDKFLWDDVLDFALANQTVGKYDLWREVAEFREVKGKKL